MLFLTTAKLIIKSHFLLIEAFRVLEFKFSWRSYQQKLLKNFDAHSSDNHFHVIAPPGSGKTILGIEIIRRLGQKTLVLAPTLTIRNQWKDRLDTFFTDTEDYTTYSFDIKKPSDITFSTYQSLHAFYKSFKDKEKYFKFFEKHSIKTVVLDEAHHLKNAWWKCLIDLKNRNSFFVVALTATPPYDSSRSEVNKYFTLCGEVDDEIAVPDLVRETDLCPHQDFVYFSKPNDLEINFIVAYRQKIATFKNEILVDTEFISFLKNHPFYSKTELFLEDIYSNTSFFSSILIFLNAAGYQIEDKKLNILGFDKGETIQFPELDLQWLQILLQHLLVEDREQLIAQEDYLKQLEKKLRRLNIFERNRINFIGEQLLYKSLAYSPSKLKSIVDIVTIEAQSLRQNLSCVILTDFIRKEFLNTASKDIETINKIGVLPIFQYLRNSTIDLKGLAVLTGSLVIIHKSVIPNFKITANNQQFSFSELETDSNFVVINVSSSSQKSSVSIITHLFESGIIKVLIGTKALLGEGWDAPSINTLILASFVGSFVSSNQMRGRAIRKDITKLNKTSNIWHLACVDPTNDNGGREVDILKRRFEAFVGITNTTIPFISNGFDRLNFPEKLFADSIEQLNVETINSAQKRAVIDNKWTTSIGSGTKLTKHVKLLHLGNKEFQPQKRVYFFDVVKFFIAELSTAIVLFYLEFILEAFNLIFNRGFIYTVYAFAAAFFLRFGYKLYKAIVLYFRYGYLYKKIRKIGTAILFTLNELKFLTTNINAIEVVSQQYNNGDVVCSLIGASNYENAMFSEALTQVLAPIDSPRYLIIKTNMFRKKLKTENFYPVPERFGLNKKYASVFQNYWKRFLGRNTLFFTRHNKGRKLLLKARLSHVHNAFKEVIKEETIWK